MLQFRTKNCRRAWYVTSAQEVEPQLLAVVRLIISVTQGRSGLEDNFDGSKREENQAHRGNT